MPLSVKLNPRTRKSLGKAPEHVFIACPGLQIAAVRPVAERDREQLLREHQRLGQICGPQHGPRTGVPHDRILPERSRCLPRVTPKPRQAATTISWDPTVKHLPGPDTERDQ